MKYLWLLLGLVIASPAQAQQNSAVATRCNGAAFYDTAVVGSTKLVSAPIIGGIYICGYAIGSVATSTISVKLTYSTAGVVNTSGIGAAPIVTGAGQTAISPGWTFISSTTAQFLVDHPDAYSGLFVPNGNQLNLTTSTNTGTIQAIVYYWTQNP